MLGFIRGGRQRAIQAIQAEVNAKYAEQLNAASAAEKKLLKKKIEAEIQEWIKKSAPPGAHYWVRG